MPSTTRTPSEGKPLRLFVAIDLPEDVKGWLDEVMASFRRPVPGVRWTRVEGWHATLKFLGRTPPGILEDVRIAVASVAARTRAFETSLTAVGAFPTPRRARVLWVGLADEERRLARISKSLDEALAPRFVAEKREPKPHLTLARLDPPRDVRELIPSVLKARTHSASFPVDRLILYTSHLSPRGGSYEALDRSSLGPRG
ncbi:MAG: RNA 2',3'-cyclic phosphodiesterase [Actinobacteria bacterium]|nr:RNA 2',3'-cyclic phosphodiesterase [Actinomycetota bacterium]